MCVGIAALVGHEGGVIFFVAGSHDAQRAYQDEAFGDGIRFDEGLDEVAGILEVDPVEICFQGCFCNSRAMDDVVELSVFLHEAGNLFDQFAGMGVVEVDEADAWVLQVGAAACGADAGPRFEALAERFVNDGASYESAGAGDEDFFLFHSFFRFVGEQGMLRTPKPVANIIIRDYFLLLSDKIFNIRRILAYIKPLSCLFFFLLRKKRLTPEASFVRIIDCLITYRTAMIIFRTVRAKIIGKSAALFADYRRGKNIFCYFVPTKTPFRLLNHQ